MWDRWTDRQVDEYPNNAMRQFWNKIVKQQNKSLLMSH